jgi:RNA polymerase sigma-70 factor (ECF subfamily)
LHPATERRTLTPAKAISLPLDFSTLYGEWFHEVSRWVRALGGLGVDHEDVTQEVFMVVRRKLHQFDGTNVSSWLYRIAVLAVRDHRRRAWFRRVVLRQPEDGAPEPAAAQDGPAVALERKQERAVLMELLSRMNETRRATFVLFEIEGLTGEEIARVQDVPVATVWTRLHYARKEFLALVAEYRGRSERKT